MVEPVDGNSDVMITPDRLKELLGDDQRAHSSFQIRHFIIRRSGLTAYGMYKQCLRELSSRWSSLKTAVAKSQADAPEDPLAAEMHREEFETSFRDKVREFCEFYMLADWLQERVGELTPEKRAKLDEEYWCVQMLKQAATDVLSTGRVSGKTIENVSSFPEELRGRLLEVSLGMPTTSRPHIQAHLNPQIEVPEFDVSPHVLQLTRTLIDDAVDDRLRALPPGCADALPGDDVAGGED
ncbi:MAG: hypothetical protein GY856_36705 [bacterium]|nr:hypothetical protein [bacterium]